MSASSGMPIPVPARLTLSELAEAIGVGLQHVLGVLEDRQEKVAPTEMVGPELSLAVGKALAIDVMIEPRDLALETLYSLETIPDTDFSDLQGKALRLVEGVTGSREALDHAIEEASEHWSVARMPVIDRTILRLGLYELWHESATPTAVILSEGVRLAQAYSTEKSGSFVNGVLGSLARAGGSRPADR